MFCQNLPAKWIDLAKGYRLEPVRPLQPQAETANAGKKVKHPELAHPTLLRNWFIVSQLPRRFCISTVISGCPASGGHSA